MELGGAAAVTRKYHSFASLFRAKYWSERGIPGAAGIRFRRASKAAEAASGLTSWASCGTLRLPRERVCEALKALLHLGTKGKETGPMFPMKKPIRLMGMVFQIDRARP